MSKEVLQKHVCDFNLKLTQGLVCVKTLNNYKNEIFQEDNNSMSQTNYI